MATVEAVGRGFALDAGEVTGAIGDSITVLPLVVALGLLTPASLPHVLLGFAVFQVVWGVAYGLPLSVEPMKALAGLAIAGAIGYGDLVAAGLLAGVLLLVAGRVGALSEIASLVGEPVVRGVQFAVACLLVVAAVDLVVAAPGVAAAGVGLAAAVAVVSRRAVALVVLAVGAAWAGVATGVPTPTLPALALFSSGGPTVSLGAAEGLAAQLAMTVGNAAVATSLLLSDLYDADVSPDRLAESMGAMNLAAVPLGALPMCHGSGGLAGKHAFGARSATANLLAGCLYAGLALAAGLLVAFPVALLGVLLVVVAASLARVALSSTGRPWLVVAIGGLAVATNVGVAFVAGAAYWHLRG
ncbi:sulfate transporter [Natronomonas salina]|uniref:putative sulfate/molybdate transporter n=1 Tax=Natronomonas salina TaxID=1710540 RepID=UPI0015B50B24|nr:putative sulfate/molybdate transporter [Natronomonas salina]QLD90613.1 sulfate transporter [Natronomonas salina]